MGCFLAEEKGEWRNNQACVSHRSPKAWRGVDWAEVLLRTYSEPWAWLASLARNCSKAQ